MPPRKLRILLAEYAVLGILASLTAIVLSTLAGYVLVRFVFEGRFGVPGPSMLALVLTVMVMTVAVGLSGSTEVWRRPPLEVWKFGGASVADADAVRHAVDLIRAHKGPLVVVVSALYGVTDALLQGARRSRAGDTRPAAAAAAAFLKRHRELAHALVPAGTTPSD